MSEDKAKVLVVEDESSIRKFISINLCRNGFEVYEADSGEAALEIVKSVGIKVMVLDIMLPGIDGYETCRKAREIIPDVIIIMLTARSQDMDKVMGLELGADDYMAKPFNPLELLARIRAIMRRTTRSGNDNGEVITFSNLVINMKFQKFYKNGAEIELTPTEFSIMKLLLSNPEKAFSRDEILNTVWGKNYFGDIKTVDVHIRRLREKIEDAPSYPELIQTVWGTGYRLRGKR